MTTAINVLGISGITGTQTATTNTTANSNGTMDMEDFLKIMTAQLANMDPTGEGSNSGSGDYISQMAQFTMLEQMAKLTQSLDSITLLSQQQMSFSLIGKSVTVNDGTRTFTGTVEKVRYVNGCIYPVIDGKEYTLSMVTEIGE